MTTTRSERWTANGTRLHVRLAGTGPLVVLLHGWPQTSHAWRHVMPLLAGRYTVAAPDMRGCGDSDRPDTGYDKQTIATDIARVIEQMDLGRARVAGHDWGGAVGYLRTHDAGRDAARRSVVSAPRIGRSRALRRP